MRFMALACDYDGTLATDGSVPGEVVWALALLKESGRRVVLVTGRELPDLLDVCPDIDVFDRVVAENGALLYRPASKEEVLLGEPASDVFVAALKEKGVHPLSVGRGIVGTWHPNETSVLEVIRDLGLELQVVFNKGAVMVLPTGVNKATGLSIALQELGLSPHNTAGIGDAENDHAFLSACECGVAVDNALPMVKERADHLTKGERGAGVIELVEALMADDLASLEPRLVRHHIPIGWDPSGAEVVLPPYGANFLLAGPSGAGKSTLNTTFLEQLQARGYEYCVIDPEGDYEAFTGAVVLGDPDQAPATDEVLQVLEAGGDNVVVNLIGIPLADRPSFFERLLPRILDLRVSRGRPHVLVVDEAHHLLPASWERAAQNLPQDLNSVLFITVHPEWVAKPVLESIGAVLVVGHDPGDTLDRFTSAVGEEGPHLDGNDLDPGHALLWWRGQADPVRFEVAPCRQERRRHVRKYAEGDLGDEFSFFFRGPEGKLNLKAQNLQLFLQMADGVDDETWLHHLHAGDYSSWFREQIKDDELAQAASEIEAKAGDLSPDDSRAAIREAVEAVYTLPA